MAVTFLKNSAASSRSEAVTGLFEPAFEYRWESADLRASASDALPRRVRP